MGRPSIVFGLAAGLIATCAAIATLYSNLYKPDSMTVERVAMGLSFISVAAFQAIALKMETARRGEVLRGSQAFWETFVLTLVRASLTLVLVYVFLKFVNYQLVLDSRAQVMEAPLPPNLDVEQAQRQEYLRQVLTYPLSISVMQFLKYAVGGLITGALISWQYVRQNRKAATNAS